MGYNRNTLIYSDEGRSKAYKPDHIKNIILVTLEKIILVTTKDKFVCHAQVIMTIRDQGIKLGFDISRISTDNDSNIIGRHRNVILPDDGSNKVSKPDIDTDYKPNIDIIKCDKNLFNDPLNLSTNTPSSNVECKYYDTYTTLPRVRKEIQPVGFSRKEGNVPEEYHLTSL